MKIAEKALKFLSLASEEALKDFIDVMVDSGEIEEVEVASFDGSIYSEALISNSKKECYLTIYVGGGSYKFKLNYWSVPHPDNFKEGVLYTFLREFDGWGLSSREVKKVIVSFFEKYGAIVAPLS